MKRYETKPSPQGKEYKTRNLVLTATLQILGFPIVKVEAPSSTSRLRLFVFEETPKLLEAIQDFWDNKHSFDPQTIITSYEDVKAQIYDRTAASY